MVICVCYTGFWINLFHDYGATISNGSVTTGQMSLVGVDHPRSNSVVPLMLCMVCCAMTGAQTLYYSTNRAKKG
jgi:hypothetical protein